MTTSEIDALIVSLQAECIYMQGVGHGMAADKLHQAAAALRTQQEEIERLTQWGAATFEAGFQERQRAERAEAERDALRADAQRYRWLRAQRHMDIAMCWALPPDSPLCESSEPDGIDAAIDAAIAQEKL